ncbi:MAG TPA: cysteine--tRNA ligase [Candidatus Saccharimonadales bacterium]|nr:cysteine--tRNA ligase [Candidatus Saccharimonadales bacterium]
MLLYNSYTRKKEPFETIEEKKVRMYVCGLTPDGPMHLGHAATAIYSDVLVRYLQSQNYVVNFVQNITDVDDDIVEKSKKAGQTWREFGDLWTQKYLHDIQRLNVLKDHGFTKATDSIPSMQKNITKLIDTKHAYVKNGSVYFSIKTFPDFGKLSHLSQEEMLDIAKQRGGHVDDPDKQNPLDFVLWQKSTDPGWESPWGKGRPGWHIECSAMIYEFLGEQIDIHGGGGDLLFPHHESEIAQSESFTGKKPFVNYWMHTAMIKKDGRKMSKSLGNLVLVSDLLKNYNANSIRWLILQNHYRSAWDYTDEKIELAAQEFSAIQKVLKSNSAVHNKTLEKEIEVAMDDDLNIPHALEIIKKAARTGQTDFVKKSLEILGFEL